MKSKIFRFNTEQIACLRSVLKVVLDDLIVVSEDNDYEDNVKTMMIRNRLIEILNKLSD